MMSIRQQFDYLFKIPEKKSSLRQQQIFILKAYVLKASNGYLSVISERELISWQLFYILK